MSKLKEEDHIDFASEAWVKQYRRQTADDLAMPLLARGIKDYLNRLARKDTGVLVRHCVTEDDAIERLVAGCAAHQSEFRACVDLVKLLIQDQAIMVKKDDRKDRPYSLVLKWFPEAQEARSAHAMRQQRYRIAKNYREQQQLELVSGDATHDVTLPASHDATSDVPFDVPRASPEIQRGRRKERVDQKARSTRSEEKRKIITVPSDRSGLSAQRAAIATLNQPFAARLVHGDPHTWSVVHSLFALFNERFRKQGLPVNSGDPRVIKIVERLAEGTPVEQLEAAVVWASQCEWVQQRSNAQSLKVLLRDAEAVSRWSQWRPAQNAGPRVQPVDQGYYDDERYGWDGQAEPEEAPAEAPAEPARPAPNGNGHHGQGSSPGLPRKARRPSGGGTVPLPGIMEGDAFRGPEDRADGSED